MSAKPAQSHYWSKAADIYEKEFIDPYHPDVKNPLLETLKPFADKKKTVADLGCGVGPLLPFLAEHFGNVIAVDFAEGMLARAKKECRKLKNVTFLRSSLTDLSNLKTPFDLGVAVNSLVMPDVRDLDKSLLQICEHLNPGGTFFAIVPAMDAVHYHTMLLLDRALQSGKTLNAARKNAAYFGEHETYEFAFGQFHYKGLEQHFWQPFEVRYRWRRAGFRNVRMKRLELSWHQFSCGKDLKGHPPPWDWFVRAEK